LRWRWRQKTGGAIGEEKEMSKIDSAKLCKSVSEFDVSASPLRLL
jgi:hypothetical protein